MSKHQTMKTKQGYKGQGGWGTVLPILTATEVLESSIYSVPAHSRCLAIGY